ncbi:mannonate dehydratase [Marispirochaeta sp.]|uniref:mannonate dehydratase n=1 Tax=Marispirochaeta sp. TaxID=2038653 RepID=UPI0029C6DB86|nr:mannonate dehydratase [Marispirochaeta sp.]
MKMTLRWFGDEHDSVPLKYIRQIPGVKGVVTSLPDIPAGDVWPAEEIRANNEQVEAAGLSLEGIESVNVHEDIKLGRPDRDRYIENYIRTMAHISNEGIRLICYNFMPVFDWTRSDLAKVLEDNSRVLSYEAGIMETANPMGMLAHMESKAEGFSLPGWEPERLKVLKELFELYEGFTEDDLFRNLKYFLDAIIPACDKYGVKMALHPDDPPWSVFGLKRIVTSEEKIARLLSMCDSPWSGLTFCTGSLGADKQNDLPAMIRRFGDRIHFAHIRNVRYRKDHDFDESAHLSSEGSLDMYEIIKAFHDISFSGIVRPDHGRMIWGESARPGYGLYDRAIGVAYMLGLWEAVEKGKKHEAYIGRNQKGYSAMESRRV